MHVYMFLVNIFPFYGIEGLYPGNLPGISTTRDNLFVVRKLNTKLNERNSEKWESEKADRRGKLYKKS